MIIDFKTFKALCPKRKLFSNKKRFNCTFWNYTTDCRAKDCPILELIKTCIIRKPKSTPKVHLAHSEVEAIVCSCDGRLNKTLKSRCGWYFCPVCQKDRITKDPKQVTCRWCR